MTFHGIYSFPRDSFIVNISMHFWATLDMTCSGSQGDLVSPVRGARDAPPMKSISYHAVCVVISVSSDVKVYGCAYIINRSQVNILIHNEDKVGSW